jgi:hypothetical protein
VARGLVARALVVIAALLVAWPSLAAQSDKYRCRFSGRVMEACCCKARAAAAPVAPSAVVKPADCCDTIKGASSKAAPSVRDAAQLATLAAAESTLALIPEAPTGRSVDLGLGHARPAGAGPPIFLRDCRLLS